MSYMNLNAQIKVMHNTLLVQTKYPIDLTDGQYEVEIKPIGKSKTSRQLRYLWGTIDDISRKLNGNTSDSELVYQQCLLMSGSKTTRLAVMTEALDDLKNLIPHFKVLEKGDKQSIVQVFYGASTMNTKEMSQLIDTTLRYASEVGLDTDNMRNLKELIDGRA